MNAPSRPPAHIRIGVIPAVRRIMGSRGDAGRTLCGAELTAYDISMADAARGIRVGRLEEWLTCPDCRRRVMEIRA
jgi:hypothetical protein